MGLKQPRENQESDHFIYNEIRRKKSYGKQGKSVKEMKCWRKMWSENENKRKRE